MIVLKSDDIVDDGPGVKGIPPLLELLIYIGSVVGLGDQSPFMAITAHSLLVVVSLYQARWLRLGPTYEKLIMTLYGV